MSFGILTRDAAGNVLSRFDGSTLRIIASIRVEALASGSYQCPAGIDMSLVQVMFQMDSVLQKVPPVITVNSNGTVTWRPYLTGPTLHTGGYLLVVAKA